MDLEKPPDVAYKDVLKEIVNVCCVKSLIIIRSNLVVTWKLGPGWAQLFKSPCLLCFARGAYIFACAIDFPFSLCKKEKKRKIIDR